MGGGKFVALLLCATAQTARSGSSSSPAQQQQERLITADRLAEFAWRTFVNPSSSDTQPALKLAPVTAEPCHSRPEGRLHPEQAAAPSLGQGWTLNADKTIRVATHGDFCLDIDGGRTTPGTPLITYPCNNISIRSVHNQQFEYAGQGGNHSIRSVLSGLCLDRVGPFGHPAVAMQVCSGAASQYWSVRRPAGASPDSTAKEIASAAPGVLCLEWGDTHSGSSGSLLAQAYRMVERLQPFYDGISGDQILVGCFGWLLDLVTEWTGDPDQPYPFVNHDARQWSGDNATYADVRDLISALKVAGERVGLPRLKIASLHVGWSSIYDIPKGPHSVRHPEIYDGGHQFNHARAHKGMRGDNYSYASQKFGATDGQDWMQLWGKQWGAFSEFAGLEAIVIRDGFSTYGNYHRGGPYGVKGAPNSSAASEYIEGVRALFRETKLAAPSTKVIGYSQASSAVGEWRTGLTDVEAIVADGFIDAYIDQSWSGAWEDVPTRHSTGLGWTHQAAYILAHRAQIEGGNGNRSKLPDPPCKGCTRRAKHYVLHDTFDSYEGWDTLDNVPLKLIWGIYAYNHAAYVVGVGFNKSFHTPDGQYLSWANSWSEVYDSEGGGKAGNGAYLNRPNGLLTRPDLALLVGALNNACGSANSLEEVFGPTLVYNRPSLDRLMRDSPDENVNEWVDEQAGMLMKFGVPILQIPDALTDPSTVSTITKLVAEGTAVLLSGRADKIHPELLKLAGAEVATGTFGDSQDASRLAPPYPASRVNASLIRQAGWESAASLQTLSLSSRVGVRATAEGKAFATVDDGGADSAVLVASSTNKAFWAQLNDLGGPEDVSLARFGTAGLYHATASLLNEASQTVMVASGINASHPATIHAWRSDGTIKVLVGNLEGAYCAGSPIPGQDFGYTSGCSIPIQPQGGFAGGTPLTLVLALAPPRMGLGPNYSWCTALSHTWSLRSLDGMRTPVFASSTVRSDSDAAAGWVKFEPLELGPREAHAFELQCHPQ